MPATNILAGFRLPLEYVSRRKDTQIPVMPKKKRKISNKKPAQPFGCPVKRKRGEG